MESHDLTDVQGRAEVQPSARRGPQGSASFDQGPHREENHNVNRSNGSVSTTYASEHVSTTPLQQHSSRRSIGQPSSIFSIQSTELRRDLGERHVNMIAFSSVVGIGLFLQSGRVIYLAGPGLAFLAYFLTGTVIWSAMACLGEMTALFPVPGAIFELPCRFVDESIGYTVGWMTWFAWVVIIGSELDAVASLFKFAFKPKYLIEAGYPHLSLEWSTAGTNSAVWVTIFLFACVVPINLLRVRIYGEIEYCIGVLKMLFLVGLIVFNVVINAQAGTGFKYYRSPWGFASHSFTTVDNHTYGGGGAHLAAMWSAMTVTIFSMVGFEVVSITAAENKDYHAQEGVKLATRKISLRIILLYTLATFVVGLNVPYDDSNLIDPSIEALSGGQHSAFVIAAVRAHKVGWPNFMNAFFVLSAISASINSLYISSRVLHALATTRRVWPRWQFVESLRRRLEHTHKGVPINAVFASGVFGLLGYLAAGKSPSRALGRLATNSTVSILIVYAVICVAFIRFKSSIHAAASGQHQGPTYIDRDQDLNAYHRKARKTYPYRSHGQPIRAGYAAFGCIAMAFFNGWRSIRPFSASDFLASYMSVFVFIGLTLVYRVKLTGFRWGLFPTRDLRDPTMVIPLDPSRRRDKFHLVDKKNRVAWDNVKEVCRWLWVWLK